MDIGLIMLVKNEARRVERALAPILDQLAEVIVYDTGSTDGTQDILRERLGIDFRVASLAGGRCRNLSELRNRGLDALTPPWRMTLDADEHLDPAGLAALRRRPVEADIAGLFLRWHTVLEDGADFDDYKCVLFRRGIRKVGLIHDNVQPSLRAAGLRAAWAGEAVLEHRPEARKSAGKLRIYRERLACAIAHEPDVPRYRWFAGYQALQEGRSDIARDLLAAAAASDHPHYPVERINAGVVLAWIHARNAAFEAAQGVYARAAALFAEAADDFEVRVNRWMASWFERAGEALARRDADGLQPPRFAC